LAKGNATVANELDELYLKGVQRFSEGKQAALEA
jgi:hypothetical protein